VANRSSTIIGPGSLRFGLAALVVVHHSFPLRMGLWAVYVFFILSGYWISTMWDHKYRLTRWPVMTFYVSRWWRLAPVFLFCTLLALACTDMRPPGNSSPFIWFTRQILVVGSLSAGNLLPPAWSLDVEAQFYLIAPGLFWLMRKRRIDVIGTGILMSFLAFLYFAYWPPQPGPWQLRFVLAPYLGFFLTGVAIHRWSWQPSNRLAIGSVAVFFAATALLLLSPSTRGGIWTPGVSAPDMWWHQLWAGAGALLITPFIALNVRSPSDRWDRLLGNWAYPLYLFHWLPRQWYYRNVNWTASWWDSCALLMMNFAIALAGSFIILWFFDRPLDRLRARWVNGRTLSPSKDSLARGSRTPGSVAGALKLPQP